MRWITRARPQTDRIACPWLIRRFIDPAAEIIFVAPVEVLSVAETGGGHSFDAPGAEFTHVRRDDGVELCTFEVLIDAFALGHDPALARLAQIVHAADVRGEEAGNPLAAGLRAIGEGGVLAEGDDERLLERGVFVYDALYAWCEREVSRVAH